MARPRPRKAIARIEPYVPGKPIDEVKQELGLTDVIKLASNENPLGPSPRAVAALARALTDLHLYPDGNATRLKAALAPRLGVTPQHIVVGNGSDEIIMMLCEAFLEPGDEVIFADHTFSEYARGAYLMAAEPQRIPMRGLVHDLAAMGERIGRRTKILFLCNPNNPTGTYVGRRAVEELLDRVPPGVIVVADEAYYEYVEADDFPDSLAYVREGRSVLVLRTFSKIYGLAGLRIGYGIAPPELAALIDRVKEPFNVNAAAQWAALAALDDEEHVQRSRAANSAGKRYFYQRLQALGLSYAPTEANFILLDTGRDSRAVFRALLRRGVIVRTGDIFGLPTHIRVTIGTSDQNLRFFSALQEVLAEVEPLGASAG